MISTGTWIYDSVAGSWIAMLPRKSHDIHVSLLDLVDVGPDPCSTACI